ncbi:MAG: hypothetical protein QM650_16980 [Microlunatus sp.]
MPDRDPLDTFDLETAFAHLAADVDSKTRARDADRAIRVAGRRRLGAAGAALAVVAVLAGVLVATLGLPHNQSSPVATPNSLPAPRSFDAAAFNEASEGWISDWAEGSSPVPTELPCTPSSEKPPEPLDSSSVEFHAGTRTGAVHKVERFDTAERARESFLYLAGDEGCADMEDFKELPDEIWSGGESIGWMVATKKQRYYELVVLHESEVAVVEVAGAGEMPEGVRKQLVHALLADLLT